jgi:HTH-type transcriptional regulator, competence development regulator
MDKFGDRIRELRKVRGYSLRQLAPLVGVGFSYLSKVERCCLDFDGTASESLIHRLVDVLGGDEAELLLLAHRIPACIAEQIFEHPQMFRDLVRCNQDQLEQIGQTSRGIVGSD